MRIYPERVLSEAKKRTEGSCKVKGREDSSLTVFAQNDDDSGTRFPD